MKRGAILNTFNKGLNRDRIPERQPEGTYTYALNMVNGSTEHVDIMTNEEGNIKFNVEDIPGQVVGATYFAEIDETVLFVADGEASSLYTVSHLTGKTTHVITDSDFGCKWGFGDCEMLYGELKLMQPCNERVIYFSSKCEYYVVNIDEVLSERKDCIKTCDHFKLFRCICTPKATPFPVEGGGFIRSGAYWVALQLEDNDGNQTNFFPVEGPVYIGGENNISGEIVNQSIRVFIDAIDSTYEKVNIAIIKRIAGVTTAEIAVSRPHANTAFTFDYVGDNPQAEQIPIDQILNRGKKFLRGSDLFQKDGVLYLYGIKQEFNPNYQPFANHIRTRVVEFEITAETQKEYNLPSLMRDEVYGVVAWINYCDGTRSRAFHVPAGVEGGFGPSKMTDVYGTSAGGQLVVPRETSPASATSEQTLPYNDSTFSDWNNQGFVPFSGSTNVPLTGPDEGEYLLAQAKGNVSQELSTVSPALDLTNSATPRVSFDYYMYGEDVSKLELRASTDGTTWATVWERTDNQGKGWLPGAANLQPYAGSWVMLSFRTTPTGNAGDIALRNISVTNAAGQQAGGANQQYSDGTYTTSTVFNRRQGNQNEDQSGEELENALGADLDNLSCNETNAQSSIDQYGDFYGVDELCTDDIPILSNMQQNIAEEMAANVEDDPTPTLNQTSSLKEAAQKLRDAIKNKEHEVRGRADWDFTKGPRYQNTNDNENAKAKRSDLWTTSTGENLLPENPRIINIYEPEVYESEIPYPDTCDCNGDRMFPEGNIKHHKMPSSSESTHFVSNQVGVESRWDPTNSPMGDTYIRLLGLEFSNVYVPKDEELPKPVCRHNPITFGILKRDLNDRSIIAKGLLTATFTGNIRGREHAMGKHGVNSFETVDVAIDNAGSKIGVNDSPNAYLFHSLDTTCQRIPLAVTDLAPLIELFGSGWRYGLYAKGEKPDLWFSGKQVDQRGARQAVSLMGQLPFVSEDRGVTGITYAPGNTVVTPPKGISLPLNNRFRESSVYLQLDSKMPPLTRGTGPESDSSFVGDVLDHSAPIKKATGWYVALKRELKSQYGSVENQKAISSGIRVTEAEPGSYTTVMGITGDIFIGMHSFKRSGYVSDKVGDLFPVQNGASDGRTVPWKRPRSICDHSANYGIQQMSIDHWATRFPEDGDASDAKNWAGLHTTNVTYAAADAPERTAPDSDYYYPRLQKTLVYYVGEFEVNPWKRATGTGLQKTEGKVFYPNLKDLELDSSFSSDIPWPEGWLNRFYVEVEQPSKQALAKKTAMRAFLALIVPALGLLITTQLESIPDTILTTIVLPALTFYWIYAKDVLFTDDWLNRMFNIPICKTDSQGGEDYVRVRGYEDNYCQYYSDFSVRNIFDYSLGLPSNYNTCRCDGCDVDATKEMFYSNKQVETSIIDSYRNFQAHDFKVIPAHAGPIRKLVVEANRFYAHTSDGMWILQYNNVTAQYDNITAILGKGSLLRDPQQMHEGATEGYLGIMDKNAAISCEAGYIFVSRPSGNLVRLYNGQIEVLSAKGLYNFFHENARFCKSGDCVDERMGTDFVLGYDPRLKRILLTKKDQEPNASWTLSYHLPSESWTSFHSYIPRFYIWDQKNLFSILKNDMWIHNVQHQCNGDNARWCTFYGQTHPMMIDFPARHETAEPWMYSETLVDLDVQIPEGHDWLRGRHIFFDEVGAWNRTQAMGLLPVQLRRTDNPDTENDVPRTLEDTPDGIVATYAGDQWRINGITDHVRNCNGAVTKRKNICSPVVEILDQGEKRGGQNNVEDRYLFYRFLAKAPTKYKLYLKSVITGMSMKSE